MTECHACLTGDSEAHVSTHSEEAWSWDSQQGPWTPGPKAGRQLRAPRGWAQGPPSDARQDVETPSDPISVC